jgi:hypothetical protein
METVGNDADRSGRIAEHQLCEGDANVEDEHTPEDARNL